MKESFYIGIITFLLGVIGTWIFLSKYKGDKVKVLLDIIKNKCFRFVKHTGSLTGVFLVILVAYLILEKLNYGEQILPNIISTALSILLIDFLLKERAIAEKEKVKILLNDKFNNISKNARKIILKFINLEQLEETDISEGVIKGIIERHDLLKDTIEHMVITEDGQVNNIEISMIDFTYYVGKELEQDVEEMLINFNQYLSSNEICFLVKLNGILAQKIFKVKCSMLYDEFQKEEYKTIEGLLIEALIDLNTILNKKRGNEWL